MNAHKNPKPARVLAQFRPPAPHPSQGGSTGYSIDFRVDVLRRVRDGTYTYVPGVSPHPNTIREWQQREAANQGVVRAFIQTGNKPMEVLHGEDRYLLAVYRMIYPKASADEVIAFIFNNSSNPRTYSRSQISECEIDLGLSRKIGAVTAHQAMRQDCMDRRLLYWTTAYPTGITDSPFWSLIDVDEMALMLQVVNRPGGKSFINVR